MTGRLAAGALAALAAAAVPAPAAAADAAFAPDRVLRAEVVVPASADSVWSAWTTDAGIRTFFAPGCHVEPRVDGAYEIWFNATAERGLRGADDQRVLSFDPPRRLAFTWNAPPSIPWARTQRTMVAVELAPVDATHTRVRLTHSGWGRGGEWDAAYDYFAQAWNARVLPFLAWRFAHGPVDWSAPPKDLPPAVASMKLALAPAAAP